MKVVILTYLVLSTLLAFGQVKSKGAVFASNSESNDGVLVKWLYSDVYHPNGFDVYRSNGNNDWKKVNSSPIVLNKSASDAKFDEETRQLFQAVKEASYEEFKSSLVRAFVMIKAIFNNELATDLGIMYQDKTVVPGNKYLYKVTVANQAEVIAVSELIEAGLFDADFSPKEIIIERKKKFISFSWKPDVYSYYGVDIYRKEIGSADFMKMTVKGPISIDITSQRNYKTTDVFFVDTTMDNEKGYIYKLKSINYLSQASSFTEEILVPIKDFVPPIPPFGFKVTPYSADRYAKLTWQAHEEEDLVGFEVYTSQDPEGAFTKVNTELIGKEKRSFDVRNLLAGDYYFVVASVDIAGNASPAGMMYGEMRDVIPPVAPANLVCKSESGKITLSWDANTEGDLMGYYIQKSLSDSNNLDNHYVIMNSDIYKDTKFEIILPKNIKNEFVYRVVALDTLYNTSKPSNNSFGQMPDVVPPKIPVLNNVSISQDTTSIIVSWIANVDRDLAGYKLMRRSVEDSVFSQINFAIIPGDVTEYKDRSVEFGNQYVYAVLASDVSGNDSKLSNEFTYILKKKPSKAVVNVTNSNYSARKKEISMQWKWEGEQELKGFVVYKMAEGGVMKPFSGLTEDSEFKIKQPIQSKLTFEIRAYALNGEIIKSKLFVVEPGNN